METNLNVSNVFSQKNIAAYNLLQKNLEFNIEAYDQKANDYYFTCLGVMPPLCFLFALLLKPILSTFTGPMFWGVVMSTAALGAFMVAGLLHRKKLNRITQEQFRLKDKEKKLVLEFFEEKQLKTTLQFLLDAQTPQRLNVAQIHLEEVANQLFEASKSTKEEEQIKSVRAIMKILSAPLVSQETKKKLRALKVFVNDEAATIANVSLKNSKYLTQV